MFFAPLTCVVRFRDVGEQILAVQKLSNSGEGTRA